MRKLVIIIVVVLILIILIPVAVMGFEYIRFSMTYKSNSNQQPTNLYTNKKSSSVDVAQDTERVSDLKALQSGLEQYRYKKGLYPNSLEELSTEISIGANAFVDPTNKKYIYQVTENGQNYILSATLSDGQVHQVSKPTSR